MQLGLHLGLRFANCRRVKQEIPTPIFADVRRRKILAYIAAAIVGLALVSNAIHLALKSPHVNTGTAEVVQ